jgi:hypothetical protein
MHGRAERAVERYKRQLRAAGEKLTIGEVAPPLVLPERNGTALVREAFTYLRSRSSLLDTNPPVAMRMAAPGRALVAWQQPDIRDNVGVEGIRPSAKNGTNTWEQAESALERQADALDLLEEAAGKGELDFQLDYTQGAYLLLPHLSPLRNAAQQLSAAAICALHRGDTDSAVKKLRSILGLVRGFEHEPIIVSQLVRIRMAESALGTEWELLQSAKLKEADLAQLERDWSQLEFVQGAEEALAMERAVDEYVMAQMRQSNAQFQQYAGGFSSGPRWPTAAGNGFEKLAALTVQRAGQIVWRSAWSYPDELKMLRGSQALLEAMRWARTQGSFKEAFQRQDSRMRELGFEVLTPDKTERQVDESLRTLFSESLVSAQIMLRRIMAAEVMRSIAVTALALKRYQLRNGHYPSDLAQLVPDFVPALPRDPADGQPLRYRLNSDGTFLLYSIGDDGKDDGGDPTPHSGTPKSKFLSWQKGRDLVWPQPVSANANAQQ